MHNGRASRAPSVLWLLVACAAAAVTVGCITLLALGMRDVMDVGGRCASGTTAFEIRQECPEGTAAVVLASFLGVLSAFVWAGAGSLLPAGRGLALLAWPGLFLALGYNFFDYGFNPPPDLGDGTAWANVSLGVMFVLMGGGPLFALLSPTVRRQVFGGPRPPVVATLGPTRFVNGSGGTIRVNGFGGSVSHVGSTLAADLAALAELHQRGVLSDDQFEAAKAARIAQEGAW